MNTGIATMRKLLAKSRVAATVAVLSAALAAGGADEAQVLFGAGLSIGDVTFAPHAFNKTWNGFSALGTGETKSASRGPDSSGPAVKVAPFSLHTGTAPDAPTFSGTGSFSETAGGGVHAEWVASADKAGRFAEVFIGGEIPFNRIGGGAAVLDGEVIPVPATPDATKQLFRKRVLKAAFHGPDGTTLLKIALDAPVLLLLQDNRHYNGDALALRLYFATESCEAGVEYAVRATFFAGGAKVDPRTLVAAGPVRIEAGPDWIPLASEPWIEPGTALDFSSVIPHHEPAGKFGRVAVRDGHFEFANLPGVTQRFYGVNVCSTANLPDTAEQAERFAAQLARLGYNAIRFHHHERWLVSKDGKLPQEPPLNREAENGTSLDPAQMEKFDLLVAACVKHGIYLTTDLYVSRAHVVPWRAIGINRDGTVPQDQFKIYCAFHEPAYSNLCAWSRNFLTHKNPHTGRSLAEEPALVALALVNEGNLGNWGAGALRSLPCVKSAWEKWCKDSARSFPEGAEAPTNDIPNDLYAPSAALFLADAETRLYERLRDFVRDELHCPVPLSNLSSWYEPAQYALVRSGFDYVDAHFYVDHPRFLGKPWRLPSRCPNTNPMRGGNRGVLPFVWKRMMDKPFCITEFNYSAPGRYRGVGGIATGALGALQDWDGIWRFAWSHSQRGIVSPGYHIGYFDLAGDPLSLAAERAALCLFLRRDLPALESEAPQILDAAALRNPNGRARKIDSGGQNAKAWTSRVGTRLSGPASPSAASRPSGNPGGEAAPKGVAVAADGTFLIDTPRTCGGFAESGAHTAGPLRFEIARRDDPAPQDSTTNHPPYRGTRCATVWVSSLDGKPIATSSHLLLTHLTDMQNSGIKYADPALTTLQNWGELPHLMRRGAAEIELSLSRKAALNAAKGGDLSGEAALKGGKPACRVYRLSPGGRRLAEVPAELAGRDGPAPKECYLRFTARTDYDPSSATYLYEIVRE